MTPGTTPTHIFNLPRNIKVEDFRITYEQGGKVVLQKEKNDENCEIDHINVVTVKLSQKDSLQFASNATVRIQLKVKTTGGDVLVSNLIKKPTNILLDKGVI